MELLVVLVVIAVLALIVVAVLRARRRRRPAPAAAPQAPADPLAGHEGVTDVRTVRAGDMVDYGGALFFVRGSLRLKEGGYSWSEHFLDDSQGQRCWISVEEDPDLEVMLWQPTDAVAEPGGDTMEVEGVRYRLEERGSARYTSEGTTTVAATGSVEYVDYNGEGERGLSFERFDGGPWEAGLGEAVALSALRVYPASSNRS